MENKSNITYKVNKAINAEDLAKVFKASGIKRPADDLPRLQKMIDNSNIILTAWYGEEIIGIARALTDYSYCCYLSDLAIDKKYQHQGIGKELVHLLQEHLGDEVALLLLSSPTAMEYYPHIGFNKIENGFIIPRKPF
ncbi:GNAT family N-acetyltransferase [Lederbergia lenta]|uniref:N-acetyltransferase GCN5 n=1 Tax=Lederbergia lenta TaxID=1467 RepID=A0A2X4WF22_LEDLE|nr:GNAT family N-acetyltransferase [Lederbergia lenta]MCM3113030.1 GNAT family N-acetyltransferase [Lederbergia lenta]MEC2322756.1 GNAT family N-acetyltransferase [Lederbergia lenta]SQI61791.1 N-acetyltransferase GCN5 [Lederbergia lenta]